MNRVFYPVIGYQRALVVNTRRRKKIAIIEFSLNYVLFEDFPSTMFNSTENWEFTILSHLLPLTSAEWKIEFFSFLIVKIVYIFGQSDSDITRLHKYILDIHVGYLILYAVFGYHHHPCHAMQCDIYLEYQ